MSSIVSIVIWTLLLAAIILVAVAGLRRWRGSDARDEESASELLTKFREVHSRGGLSDEEFRTIKTQLADRLQQESDHAKIDSRYR